MIVSEVILEIFKKEKFTYYLRMQKDKFDQIWNKLIKSADLE